MSGKTLHSADKRRWQLAMMPDLTPMGVRIRECMGLNWFLGVVPAAVYVANPWSVMVFAKFTGG